MAKRCGGIDSLYPNRDMLNCPHDLSMAITGALITLGYLELPEDEAPDESIWHHPERMEEWWEAVKERRKNPDMVPIENESADMTQNEVTAKYRKG